MPHIKVVFLTSRKKNAEVLRSVYQKLRALFLFISNVTSKVVDFMATILSLSRKEH